jgi:hypothetical protein
MLRAMNRSDLARLHRTLRHRQQLTQEALAAKAGVGQWVVRQIEAVELDRLRLADMERSFDALGCRLRLTAYYNGAAAERLLDEGHAALVGAFVLLLHRRGWQTSVEVSFSEWGERGSIDILGWHPAARALLVVEVKTELAGLESTLRPLDVKVRLAPEVAGQRYGWHPRAVARVLVLPENSSARRTVRRHASVLDATLPARTRALRAWLRRPGPPVSGIWFLSLPQGAALMRNPSARRRVRRPDARSARGGRAAHDRPTPT